MPQHKMPETLSVMCIKYMAAVVQRIEEEYYSKQPNFIHSSLYESANSVFKSLPFSIVEDIIQDYHFYYPNGIERYFPLEILLNHKPTRIKLHFAEQISKENFNAQTLLKKIGSIGTSIIDLHLSGSILYFSDYFIHFVVHSLKNVRYLTLHCLKLDDSILIAIGKSCKCIEYLSVSGWGITDCGLKGLAPISVEPLTPSLLKCVKLEYDRYHSPKITKYGVLHILLHLPKLEIIDVPHLKDALLMLALQHSSNEIPFTLSLCELYELQTGPFTVEFISLLGKICPLLHELSVVVQDAPTLLPLCKFAKLSTLKVHALNASMNIFQDGMLPVLKSIGLMINHLELCVTEIDLTVIDICCPALSIFDISDVQTLKKSSFPMRKTYTKLHVLKIFAVEENSISSDDLLYLLSNCLELEHLYLCTCDGLDDKTLIKILLSNPFQNILEIELTDINTITLNGIKHLVFANSNLVKLHIFSCESVSGNDIKFLRDSVAHENLNLCIEFHDN